MELKLQPLRVILHALKMIKRARRRSGGGEVENTRKSWSVFSVVILQVSDEKCAFFDRYEPFRTYTKMAPPFSRFLYL